MVRRNDDQCAISSGLAIIYDGMILLGRPGGGKKKDTSYSIPKGHVERGESVLDAAIRETYEEVGIVVRPDKIKAGPYNYRYKNMKKNLHFYIVPIDDLSEIGMDGLQVPASNLKPNKDGILEIEWAGFLTIEEARGKASFSMQRLIDMIEKYLDGNYYFQ